MEISILLAEQIIAMFLTMAVGFGVVRAGLFKTEDSRIIYDRGWDVGNCACDPDRGFGIIIIYNSF